MFDFLKKKRQESTIVPIDNNTPPSMDELMPNLKGDLPPINDIPLPPKPEEGLSAPSIDEPKEEMAGLGSSDAQRTEVSDEAKEPEATPKAPPETDDLEPKQDEDTFSLPDFDEEELKLEEESSAPIEEIKLPETKEIPIEDIPELPTIETEEIDDFKLPYELEKTTEISDVPGEKLSDEIKPIVKEKNSAPKIEPIFTTNKAETGEEFFMSGEGCKQLFEIIESTEKKLTDSLEEFTENEDGNKSRIQLYKTFHDSLDVAQEKLMQIDNLLFEK